MPSSPNLDTTFGVVNISCGWVNGTSHTTGVQSNNAATSNELLVACISYEANGNPSGQEITAFSCSLGSLTFSKLGYVQNTTSGGDGETLEVWAAPCSSQFNSGATNWSFSLTWSGYVDECSITAFMLQGLNSISAPLDTSGSNPASAFNSTSTTPPTVSMTTSQADDLLIAVTGRAQNFAPTGTPGGWTNAGSNTDASGNANEGINVDYMAVSSAGSQSYTNTNGTSDLSYASLLLAFTANAGGGVTGTFAPTEADDTFAGAGYVPATGTIAVTENVDTFAGVGYTSLTAALAVTETPDTFAGVGYGPPARSGRRRVFIIS